MAEQKDLQDYLSVGCPMVLHPEPFQASAARYNTCVRGWSKGSYLLIDRPRINNRFAALRENQPCIMRFLHNGLACAFDTIILDWDTRQYHSYCRISWPTNVETVSFRKFERVRAQIPCKFMYDDAPCAGMIEDLSIGGCRIRTSSEVANYSKIKAHIELPNGSTIEAVKAEVKNVRVLNGEFLLGCQFQAGQPEVESDIAFYVTTVLERGESRAPEKPRILIIDENRAIPMVMRNLFEQQNIEVFPTTSTLDGLSRLRVSSPEAVLISDTMSDLRSVECARLIRATRGYENLPLFLYGGDFTAEEIAKAGATECFGKKVPAMQIAKRVMAEVETRGGAARAQDAAAKERDAAD